MCLAEILSVHLGEKKNKKNLTLSGQLHRFDLDPFTQLVLTFPKFLLIQPPVAGVGAGQRLRQLGVSCY